MSTTNTKTATPFYVQFAAAILEKCAELGLEPQLADTETGFPQNKGYFFVRFGADANSPALIVPKGETRISKCDVHIDLSGLPGHMPLAKPNGKVICHFAPDSELIAKHLLPRLVGASKRPTAFVAKAQQVTASAAPVKVELNMYSGLEADDSSSEEGEFGQIAE